MNFCLEDTGRSICLRHIVQYDWGGAVKTLEYAVRKKKRVINMAESIEINKNIEYKKYK